MSILIVSTLILAFLSFDLYDILRSRYGEWGFAVAIVIAGLAGAFIGIPLDFLERRRLKASASRMKLKEIS